MSNPEKILAPKLSTVTYLGHASILIETNGIRILTDPVLRNRISFLRRTTPTIDKANYADIDVVLISHLHYDHLDTHRLGPRLDDGDGLGMTELRHQEGVLLPSGGPVE